MGSPINIAVDVMGGDNAPESIIGGVAEALQRFGDEYHLLLVGDEARIRDGLTALGVSVEDPRIEFVPTTQVVGMDEHPVQAIRGKRDSSILVSADLVKSGRAQGLFSAGNTGAAVAASFIRWRVLPGIDRPGIATELPGTKSPWLLMDSGANVDCSARELAHFAIMGDIYARTMMGIENPRVGLLANGTEECKGNKVTLEAFGLIKEIPGLNFIGNIEGHDLFGDHVDVVVCDGFVGNIVLKSSEQLAKTMGKMIKEELLSRFLWKMGAALCRGAFRNIKKRTDASEVGGAPLLGVNGSCVIGHGNSSPHAAANGIRAVGRIIASQVNQRIVEQIQKSGMAKSK